MGKSIYSLALSDEVVAAIDALAQAHGLSRSAMINSILAERVAYVTPESRIREIISSVQNALDECFVLADAANPASISARSVLKFRYKPTAKYSAEVFYRGGQRVGMIRVNFRTRNADLIEALVGFFGFWTVLEMRNPVQSAVGCASSFDGNDFRRQINAADENITEQQLGKAIADYMALFDGTMKAYFSELPDENNAAFAAEQYYQAGFSRLKTII